MARACDSTQASAICEERDPLSPPRLSRWACSPFSSVLLGFSIEHRTVALGVVALGIVALALATRMTFAQRAHGARVQSLVSSWTRTALSPLLLTDEHLRIHVAGTKRKAKERGENRRPLGDLKP